MTVEQMDVVAAVIVKDDKILITQRKEGSFMGGRWEFPGGKLDKGENPKDGLKREILEELGIKIKVNGLFHVNNYTYKIADNKREIKLITYLCEILEGELRCIGCSDFRWISSKELRNFDFVEADLEVVGKLINQVLLYEK